MKKIFIAALLVALPSVLFADARDDYNRRAAERDMQLFRELDLDKDNSLTRTEVRGTIELQARFNDLDINRDDRISLEEMQRYIFATYGVGADKLGSATAAKQ